jgi:hypothetical protein
MLSKCVDATLCCKNLTQTSGQGDWKMRALTMTEVGVVSGGWEDFAKDGGKGKPSTGPAKTPSAPGTVKTPVEHNSINPDGSLRLWTDKGEVATIDGILAATVGLVNPYLGWAVTVVAGIKYLNSPDGRYQVVVPVPPPNPLDQGFGD